MKRLASEEKWRFPFLCDETQEVARAFDAQCTPEFYLFDAGGKLGYRGQFDDSRPSNGKAVTGRDLRLALEALASRPRPLADQKTSVGGGVNGGGEAVCVVVGCVAMLLWCGSSPRRLC